MLWFVFSIHVWKWKSGGKWERPGNSYHVTSCEVDVGGPGPTTNWFALYILEREFPTSQMEYSLIMSGALPCDGVLDDEE